MGIKIDKSKYTPEQLAMYEELIAIGKADVDPAGAEEEMEEDKPPFPPKKKPTEKADGVEDDDTKKSADSALATALAEAQKDLADMRKSFEMKEMTDVAKKYAALGKKEDELAQTLYDMKKSDEATYNSYVALLDEHLGLVEKSGMFAEIGKSGGAGGPATVEAKIEAKAAEIMKSNPAINHTDAIAKAWDENPDLVDEYDKEYYR